MTKIAMFALVVLALAICSRGGAQTPEKRVALVIGNDAYQSLPRLANAATDASDIGRSLEIAGFETIVRTDVKRRELYQLIDAFAAKIAGSPDTVGLFYYAGHGIQANGKNYLVPVDAALASESDLEAEAVEAGKVLRAMDQARNRINIVILDACRDNPLPKGRSLARGLTSMHAPRGTFIGYAAAPGQSAQDGEAGENGVFTGVLIKEILVPGLQLEDVFKRVIGGVSERTGGKQLPWIESSVQGNFYFVGGSPNGASPPQSAVRTDAEIVFWQSIPRNAAAADYEEYLRQFPQGRFAGLARNRLAVLRHPPLASPQSVPRLPEAEVKSAPIGPPQRELEAEGQRQEAELADRERQTYSSARGNLTALRSYVASCSICTYVRDASSEATKLQAAEQEERAYNASRGNLNALRGYVNTCDACALKAAALEEIRVIEAGRSTNTSVTAQNSTRYRISPCGSIIDSNAKLEWYVGSDMNTTWPEALEWIKKLDACGSRWSLPTASELKSLFNVSATAGTGFFTRGRYWPAHIDPIFSKIGGGSWVWAAGSMDGATAPAVNLNQGIAVRLSPLATQYTVRAFAVKR